MALDEVGKARPPVVSYIRAYAWAIIAVLVVLAAAMYVLGTHGTSQRPCGFGSGLLCGNSTLYTNGQLALQLDATNTTVNVTAVGCNAQPSYSGSYRLERTIQGGSSSTFTMQCYNGTDRFSGSIGDVFRGYLMVNYTYGANTRSELVLFSAKVTESAG